MDTPSHTNHSASRAQLDPQTLSRLVERWNDEHADLTSDMERIHCWLTELNHQRLPPAGDLVGRLDGFRDRLLRHFEREEELGLQLRQACDWVEVTATHRQMITDHQHLVRRLDALIAKLGELGSAFGLSGCAVDEIGLFVDAVELHEEQETQNLQWLTARPLDFRKLPR